MFLGGELDSKEDTTWPLSLFLVFGFFLCKDSREEDRKSCLPWREGGHRRKSSNTNNRIIMTKERLQLSLSAGGLKNVAGLGSECSEDFRPCYCSPPRSNASLASSSPFLWTEGTSDPFAIVTLLASGPGEKPKVLGRTEVIKNSLVS